MTIKKDNIWYINKTEEEGTETASFSPDCVGDLYEVPCNQKETIGHYIIKEHETVNYYNCTQYINQQVQRKTLIQKIKDFLRRFI